MPKTWPLVALLSACVGMCAAAGPVRSFESVGFEVATSSDGLVVAMGSYAGHPGYHEYLRMRAIGGNLPLPQVMNGTVDVRAWTKDGWVQVGSLLNGEHHLAMMGYSLAMSDDGKTLAVGSPGARGIDTGNGPHQGGKVQVYRLDGAGEWAQMGDPIRGSGSPIEPPSDTSAGYAGGTGLGRGDGMGYSVDISGDGNVVACMSKWGGGGSSERGVRVFAWNGTGWQERVGVLRGTNRVYSPVSISGDGSTVTTGVTTPDSNTSYIMAQRWTEAGGWQAVGGLMEIGPIDKTYVTRVCGTWSVCERHIPQQISSDGSTVVGGMRFHAGGTMPHNTTASVYSLQGGEWVRRGQPISGDAGWSMGGFVTVSDDGSQILLGSDLYNQGNMIQSLEGLSTPCVQMYRWSQDRWVRRYTETCAFPFSLSGVNALRISGDGSSMVLMNLTADGVAAMAVSYLTTPPPDSSVRLSMVLPGVSESAFTADERFDFMRNVSRSLAVDISQVSIVGTEASSSARRMLLQSSLTVDYTVAYNSTDFPEALASAIDASPIVPVDATPSPNGAGANSAPVLATLAAAALASVSAMLFVW